MKRNWVSESGTPGADGRAQVAGKTVKLQIPRPTTETRTALAKKLKTLAEEAKKGVRAHRQKAMQQCKKLSSKVTRAPLPRDAAVRSL